MQNPEFTEATLRQTLGIPETAKRVLLLQESSHWDTNWLRTSEEYFSERIEPIFTAIFHELRAEPTRVFAIESIFFLKLYWERHPERHVELRHLLDNRRLRLLGASLTTPDTLLPHPESVLRDYLFGQQWLREIGCLEFPRIAYFPDNFGHSPSLPSLMKAAGVDAVGVTRIDGMHFVGSDWRMRGKFPLAGSTAHQLQREEKSLDFVWRDPSGAEVLCHWNAFTYFQGDMLGHLGIIRWNGALFGVPWRSRSHVARQLDGFVRALEPLARTPYLFCPIGCDFNPPIPGLVSLVERYNAERSHKTGTYVVLAGMDDYFALLNTHRARLPVLEVDPNPAWMGFYASRPELKARHSRTARRLIEAEGDDVRSGATRHELTRAWELVALSNHHDYITGTSPDRIVEEEQVPWLIHAESLLGLPEPTVQCTRAPPRFKRRRGYVHIDTPCLSLTLSEERGGCLTSLRDSQGHELLRGLGFDLVVYRDSGGLWRLGHEYNGGSFRRIQRASDRPAEVRVCEERDAVRVDITSWLGNQCFRRSLLCRTRDATLQLRVHGLPPVRTTVTSLFELSTPLSALDMDAAGGVVCRPLEKLYAPTFWPALSRVEAGSVSLGLDSPTGVSGTAAGSLEWIVARHATKERAFGVLPVLAHPIGGTVSHPQTHDVIFAVGKLPRVEHAWVRCSDKRVRVGAIKRAADKNGVIVRLHSDVPSEDLFDLALEGNPITAANLCDAREANLHPFSVRDGVACIRVDGGISTVRLLQQPGGPTRPS